jgi:hypothetical protein
MKPFIFTNSVSSPPHKTPTSVPAADLHTDPQSSVCTLSLPLSENSNCRSSHKSTHLSLSLSLSLSPSLRVSESLVSSRPQSEDGSDFFLEISSCIKRARRKSASFGANPSYPQNGELHLNCWGLEGGRTEKDRRRKGIMLYDEINTTHFFLASNPH